jgi:hypothetical protein
MNKGSEYKSVIVHEIENNIMNMLVMMMFRKKTNSTG